MWWTWPSLAFLPCTITTPRGPKPFIRDSASAAVGGGQIVSLVHREDNHGHPAMPCSTPPPIELP